MSKHKRVTKQDIENELNWLIKMSLNDFTQSGNDIYPAIPKIMKMIEQYSSQNDVLTPIRALTVAEQSIFSIFRNYFMYNLISNWNIKYYNYSIRPYDLRVEIKTNNFYGTHHKLDLEIYTFKDDPTKIWLVNIGQLEFQARRNHMNQKTFIEIVKKFGLEYYQNQVQYRGHANGLETAIYKLLNLARYLAEGNTEIPSHKYINDNHIAKIFVQNPYRENDIETRFE